MRLAVGLPDLHPRKGTPIGAAFAIASRLTRRNLSNPSDPLRGGCGTFPGEFFITPLREIFFSGHTD
jgi:hypothetical protein